MAGSSKRKPKPPDAAQPGSSSQAASGVKRNRPASPGNPAPAQGQPEGSGTPAGPSTKRAKAKKVKPKPKAECYSELHLRDGSSALPHQATLHCVRVTTFHSKLSVLGTAASPAGTFQYSQPGVLGSQQLLRQFRHQFVGRRHLAQTFDELVQFWQYCVKLARQDCDYYIASAVR